MASEITLGMQADSYRLAVPPFKKINADDDELQEVDIREHRLSLTTLIDNLQTDLQSGLSNESAKERLLRDGPNIVTPDVSYFKEFAMLLYQETTFFLIFVLLMAVVVLFIVYNIVMSFTFGNQYLPLRHLYLYLVLLAILLLSTAFLCAHKVVFKNRLKSIEIPHKATVIRDGFTYEILATEVVIGDIVIVKAGDKIPADIRILSSTSFKVEKSILTGDPEPFACSTEYTNENILETKNVALYSSFALEGTCKGVVINTGKGTVFKRLVSWSTTWSMSNTPVTKEIHIFVSIVFITSLVLGVLYYIITLFLSYYWTDSLMYFIGIVIVCVPEGLIAIYQIYLTITVSKMAEHRIWVRGVRALEMLRSASVICCNQTGTLTQNKWLISNVYFDKTEYRIDFDGVEWQSDFNDNSTTWKSLCRAAMLCNSSEFIPQDDDKEEDNILFKRCSGSSVDAALLKFMEVAIGNVEKYRYKNRMIFQLPFCAVKKYQFTIHNATGSDSRFLFLMKGAPEKILDFCETELINGGEYIIDKNRRFALIDTCNRMAENGEHVIGFAEKRLDSDQFGSSFSFEENYEKIPLSGLRFIGFVSFDDPPRAAVTQAIETCKSAGMKVIMITGDHPVTAKANARVVGILSENNKTISEIAVERGVAPYEINEDDAKAFVMDGDGLKSLLPEEIDKIICQYNEIVFARTTPEQKLLIVQSCQRLGHVVVFTGDSVNDSQALKQADIGISMGVSGCSVSRESADMVLLDDNFALITTAIRISRSMFLNMKKSICYSLTSNVPEVIPFILFIIMGLPLPFGIITALLIDIVMDLYSSISLIHESTENEDRIHVNIDQTMTKEEKQIIEERNTIFSRPLLSMSFGQIGILQTAAGFFTYFIVMSENGFWPQRLVALRQEWDSLAINDVADSYGQEWNYHQRKYLEYTCQGAFFITIVMTQWINLIICKSRRNPVFTQGMWNHHLTLSLFVSAALAIIIIYVPGLNVALQVRPMRFTWWLPVLPYMTIIFIYDGLQKYIVRKVLPPSWLERETVYL